jgi:hypothetical protein
MIDYLAELGRAYVPKSPVEITAAQLEAELTAIASRIVDIIPGMTNELYDPGIEISCVFGGTLAIMVETELRRRGINFIE